MTKTQMIQEIMQCPANQLSRKELRAMSTDKLEELYEDLFGHDAAMVAEMAAEMDADLAAMESETLTEEPVENVADADQSDIEEVVAADNAEEEALFAAACQSVYDQLDGAMEEGVSKCAALRAVASTGHHTRKAFIEGARMRGINKHTAATQWQRGRSGK